MSFPSSVHLYAAAILAASFASGASTLAALIGTASISHDITDAEPTDLFNTSVDSALCATLKEFVLHATTEFIAIRGSISSRSDSTGMADSWVSTIVLTSTDACTIYRGDSDLASFVACPVMRSSDVEAATSKYNQTVAAVGSCLGNGDWSVRFDTTVTARSVRRRARYARVVDGSRVLVVLTEARSTRPWNARVSLHVDAPPSTRDPIVSNRRPNAAPQEHRGSWDAGISTRSIICDTLRRFVETSIDDWVSQRGVPVLKGPDGDETIAWISTLRFPGAACLIHSGGPRTECTFVVTNDPQIVERTFSHWVAELSACLLDPNWSSGERSVVADGARYVRLNFVRALERAPDVTIAIVPPTVNRPSRAVVLTIAHLP